MSGIFLSYRPGLSLLRVEGKRYFQCSPKHAVFVRSDKVTIGDFPEEDLLADDDEI